MPPDSQPGTLRVLVVGCGAIGTLYGTMLHEAGAEVSVLARSDFDTVRRRGLVLHSVWGEFAWRPAQVVRHGGDLTGPPPDLVLVALKVLPEIDTAELVRPALGPDTAVLLIQNGVEIEDPVAAALPGHELLSGLAFVCSCRRGPGEVEHQDYGRLTLGRWPGGPSALATRLAALFGRTPVPCAASETIIADRWRKLIWNAPFNTIAVLGGGLDTSQILAVEGQTGLVRAVMQEVCAIARALGHDLGEADIERNLAHTRQMRPYYPSTLLDYQAGRPMEVAAILGHALRAAARVGVAAPRLATLHGLLTLADRHRRE